MSTPADMLREIAEAFSAWIDVVTRTVGAPLANVKPVRRIDVVEDEAGALTISFAPSAKVQDGDLSPYRVEHADGLIGDSLSPEWAAAVRGAVVELTLQPSRFVFRPLELPGRAKEFLDGIVRAQIDRLTPWSPSESVYHWTPPNDIDGEHIGVTVVATGRAAIVPVAQAFSDLGARGVAISTMAPEEGRVTVYNQRTDEQSEFRRLRLALTAVLLATGFSAMLSAGIGSFITDSYDSQQQQIERRIAERRAVMRGNQAGAAGSPLESLVRRKQTTPASVVLIEALSALLPDQTYATEVRMEGDKVQIVGVTNNAPSLIKILEQSPYFSSAGFFAATTRAANEPGERFHIEGKLKPHFGLGT